MLVAAFLGIATKYAEGLLAVKFRVFGENGQALGGPFYYIENGMGKKWKWLAKAFAIFGVCAGLMGIGTFTQVNGISTAIHSFFDAQNNYTVNIPFIGEYSWSVVIASIALAIIVGLVVIGGISRISTVATVVVPFMAIAYVIFGLLVIFSNLDKLPMAIELIVKGAFNPSAVTGGVVGTMFIAMQKGVARGIFSNESGLGSAPIASAAAKTNSPVRQGLVTMTGTFLDTIVVCTMTGLTVILTGAWQVEGLEGVNVTSHAFGVGIPFLPERVTSFILMVSLVFFAFTTIIGWDYYSESCLSYLTKGNKKATKVFRYLYIIAVLIGPYMTIEEVWTIADIFNGLMAIPNMIALFALSGIVAKETKEFFDKRKAEKNK
jgi:AGCS family alanine or glycine:cation symporter